MRLRVAGVLAAALVTCALAVPAGTALANGSERPGSSVKISASLAGRNRIEVRVSGTNALANGVFAGFTYGVDLYIVDTKLNPGPCEPALNAEFDLAESDPRAVDDLTGSPLGVGKSGPFSFSYPIDVSGFVPGPRVICAYDMYMSTTDAAWAETKITIDPTGASSGSSSGSGSAGSSGSGGPAASARPAVSALPRITRAGDRLLCDPGAWSGNPTYRYRWIVVGGSGGGASSSLALTGALKGHQVECAVTATNSKGSASASSQPFKVT